MGDFLDNLKTKFRRFLHLYQSPSGILQVEEHGQEISDEIVRYLHLTDGEATERIIHSVESVHGIFIAHNTDSGWLTVDETVETFCWYILKYPQSFSSKWSHLFGNFFDIFDQDRDGYINEEQFGILYMPYTMKDKAFVARAFAAVDTEKTGKVSRKQYVLAYVKYFTDPSITYNDLPLF